MGLRTAMVAAATMLAGCAGDQPMMQPGLEVPPDGQGFHLQMEFDTPPGAESWKCQILPPLDFDATQNVQRVQHLQSTVVHHMDIVVLLSAGVNKPPGQYDCAELYNDYPKLMEETNLYAAQSASGEVDLPPGVVAAVPPALTLMYEVHHINASTQPMHVKSEISAWTIPKDQVVSTIWGEVVRDRYINIDPMSDHTEWSRCILDKDIDLLILSTHTHRLGKDAHILRWDGTNTGEELYVNTDWQAPKLLNYGTMPIHMHAGEGFELRCHYVSDRTTEVNWGFSASDEMCQFVFVYSPGNTVATCNVTETSDGVIMM
jgi:hypothetical protein